MGGQRPLLQSGWGPVTFEPRAALRWADTHLSLQDRNTVCKKPTCAPGCASFSLPCLAPSVLDLPLGQRSGLTVPWRELAIILQTATG